MDKRKAVKRRLERFQRCRLGCIGAAIIMLFVICSNVSAFLIPTGNDNLTWRWDNTFRYNLGYRVTQPMDAVIKNANMDDGDRNFDKSIVTNRLDVLSEMDLVYKGLYAARISAAGWYDNAYEGTLANNVNLATYNHMENGVPVSGINDTTKFYHRGPNAEILDAFVSAKASLGDIPFNVRVGRAATMWGEALYSNTHSVGYAQIPLDLMKAVSVPGVEVKELYRPLFNAYVQAQLSDNLSMSAQWMLQWEPNRYAESGSFFSATDILFWGGETFVIAPGSPGVRFRKVDDVQPTGRGDWGLSFRYQPAYMAGGGALGAYYRRTSDRGPMAHFNFATGSYYMAFADGIDIFGVSYSQRISSTAIAGEISYRQNMPLNYATINTAVRPEEGRVVGPIGKTWHGLVNVVTPVIPPKWTSANFLMLVAELGWSHWDSVTQGWNLFKGNPSYKALDRVTDHNVTAQFGMTPSWYQIIPGWDLSVPISYGIGLYGNSAVSGGGNEHAGSYSVGIIMDGWAKYNLTLKYSNNFGEYETGTTGAITVNNNTGALYDRGVLMFTFKFTL